MDLGLEGVHVLITGRPRRRGYPQCSRSKLSTNPLLQARAEESDWRPLSSFTVRFKFLIASSIPMVHDLAADQGALVTTHYNSNYTPLKAFEDLLKRHAIKADLTKEQEVIDLFNEAQETYGPVQILVINHAISVVEDADLWDMSLDRWQTTINANLTSSFLVAREYLRSLKVATAGLKEEAAIVLIGSTAGKYGKALFTYIIKNP